MILFLNIVKWNSFTCYNFFEYFSIACSVLHSLLESIWVGGCLINIKWMKKYYKIIRKAAFFKIICKTGVKKIVFLLHFLLIFIIKTFFINVQKRFSEASCFHKVWLPENPQKRFPVILSGSSATNVRNFSLILDKL